jgi:hypothetical protein
MIFCSIVNNKSQKFLREHRIACRIYRFGRNKESCPYFRINAFAMRCLFAASGESQPGPRYADDFTGFSLVPGKYQVGFEIIKLQSS